MKKLRLPSRIPTPAQMRMQDEAVQQLGTDLFAIAQREKRDGNPTLWDLLVSESVKP